ncbi:MAG: sugar phosphate isomerase/epimerase [Trueperaceae bacterium]|nr:sugar phosphate isomerase/epimerase [Trueperaceae bacterium]
MDYLANLGAALMIDALPEHLDWLSEAKRDLEIQDFFQFDLLDGDWQTPAKRAKELLKDYPGRIGMHGPFWGLNLANPDPRLRQAVSERLEQGLEVAELLGATHMVIHSPIDAWQHRHIVNNAVQRAATIELIQKTLARPLERAKAIGCTLVMEDIMDLDPRLQLDLIKAMDSEAMRMSVDVGHAFCMHIQHDAPPPDQFIAEAGDYLEHVHLQDTDGYLDRHWPLGTGKIQWNALLEELAKLEHRPRLIIELKDKSAVQSSVAWLKSLSQNP